MSQVIKDTLATFLTKASDAISGLPFAQQVSEFSASEHLNKHLMHFMAFYGAYHFYKGFLQVPICGVLKHTLRPRKNLLSRYGKGSWAVITEANKGNGKAVAQELAEQGFNLVLISSDGVTLEKTGKFMKRNFQVEYKTVAFDLTTVNGPEAASALIALLKKETEGLDISILVHSAESSAQGIFHHIALPSVFQSLSLTCSSYLVITQYIVDLWNNQEKKGRKAIVDISSSQSYYKANPLTANYGASKRMNSWFTNGLKVEYPWIDTLTVVSPGTPPNQGPDFFPEGRSFFEITAARANFCKWSMFEKEGIVKSILGWGATPEEECAVAVRRSLGWEPVTLGHWRHGIQDYVAGIWPFNWISCYLNKKEMARLSAEAKTRVKVSSKWERRRKMMAK